MKSTFPKYCGDAIPLMKKQKYINNTRQYLLFNVSPVNQQCHLVATITSPTISNKKKFVNVSNHKKALLVYALPKYVRKTSDSSTSSASNGKEGKIPSKKELAEKKQRRWAMKNGIQLINDSPQVIGNEIQLKGAAFLRELAHTLIFINKPQKKDIGNENMFIERTYKKESITLLVDNNFCKLPLPADTTHGQKEKSDANRSYHEESAVITLAQCECHRKGKVRRQTTGTLQL
jgi:hypothetical protein